jgi:hypothetical protein
LYDILSAGNFENRLCRVLGEEDVSENHGRGGGERFLHGRLCWLTSKIIDALSFLPTVRAWEIEKGGAHIIIGAPLFLLVE